MDAHVWRLVYKWAKLTHPNKPKRWIIARYFGEFNPFRRDKWVFGDRSSGFYLRKFAWTPIVRHRMVPGMASPDDPSMAEFWATRRRRGKPPLGRSNLRLLQAQHGRCQLCGGLLLLADHGPQGPREWELWLKATRTAIRKHAITVVAGRGTPDTFVIQRLIHAHCRPRLSKADRQARPPVREP